MNNTKKIALAAVFVVLTAVGAFIKIPIPYVSITLQILFVIIAGVCLGSKWGAFSQLAYVAAGLLGLPVFTTGGGFGSVLSPTFGYILGFILGA
ncbi:MAG: biotin transporter BioY, partial [Clostridia bacterium]|nr:biotin transporter BioY [Clostridia bacterium]